MQTHAVIEFKSMFVAFPSVPFLAPSPFWPRFPLIHPRYQTLHYTISKKCGKFYLKVGKWLASIFFAISPGL